jgi:hypothetical protein
MDHGKNCLYSSPDIYSVIKSRKMRLTVHVAHMGEGRSVYRVLVGRPKVKRPLGRPRFRWEYNIKMDLREIGIDGLNWIQLLRLESSVGFLRHGNEPLGSIQKAGYSLSS